MNPSLIKAADKNDEAGVNSALSCGVSLWTFNLVIHPLFLICCDLVPFSTASAMKSTGKKLNLKM